MSTEIWQLIDAIRFERLTIAADPWAGVGTIGEVLPIKTYSSDLNPIYWYREKIDALSEDVIRWLQRCNADAVVCSPWFTVLDLAIPRLLTYGAKVTCIHAPAHYITNMPPPRRTWMTNYMRKGLVVVVGLRDIGPLGRRCCWILFFKDSSTRRQLLTLDERSLEYDGYSRCSFFF